MIPGGGLPNPSQDNIRQAIMQSDPISDWSHGNLDWKRVTTYKKDVNLRFEIDFTEKGTQREDFKAEWANRHPDPQATGYWCDLYYGQTQVERFLLVSVDGGRAMLPIPIFGEDRMRPDQVLPLDYKVAEIHDTIATLSEYMARSGLTILNEG